MPAERAYLPAVPTELMTADELLRASLPDRRVELIRGVLVVREPVGGRHGRVAAELARLVGTHVHDHDLGVVYGAETGFTLTRGPDTVRAPDVAFLQRDRVPTPEPVGFLPLAPDLAVEILSPDDRPGDTLAKVGDWLEAGTRRIWVIDPDRRQARVYRGDGSVSIIEATESLRGEEVLPGFSCSLAQIL